MTLIAAMEPDARPRERLAARGAEQLTDGELLAVVLGAGTRGASALEVAAAVLRGVEGPAGLLRATPAELSGFAGIGPVRATPDRGGARARAPRGRRPSLARPAGGRRVRGLDVFPQPARAAVGRGVLGARARRAPPRAERALPGARLAHRRRDSPARRLPARSSGRRPRPSSFATTTRRAIRRPRGPTSSSRRGCARWAISCGIPVLDHVVVGWEGLRQPRGAQLEVAPDGLRLPPCARPPALPSLVVVVVADSGARRAGARVRGAHADRGAGDGGRFARLGGRRRGAPLLNPSGMSLTKAYTIDGTYGYASRLSEQFLHASIVDSTSPFNLAGGLYYTYHSSSPSGGLVGARSRGGAGAVVPLRTVRRRSAGRSSTSSSTTATRSTATTAA